VPEAKRWKQGREGGGSGLKDPKKGLSFPAEVIRHLIGKKSRKKRRYRLALLPLTGEGWDPQCVGGSLGCCKIPATKGGEKKHSGRRFVERFPERKKKKQKKEVKTDERSQHSATAERGDIGEKTRDLGGSQCNWKRHKQIPRKISTLEEERFNQKV